jgi:hypothetical protein
VGKLKRRNAWNKATEAGGTSKIVVGAKFILALLALATLCVCAAAQDETTDEWYKKGRDLIEMDLTKRPLRHTIGR